MDKLLIIKTANTEKIKGFLAKNHIEHQIIYDEFLTTTKKASSKKDKLQERGLDSFSKLRQYIEMKSKENIFSDYGKAIKDKELEAEKSLLENDLD